METTPHAGILYIIAVHGHAPEFWPAVAYRRGKGRIKTAGRQKEIKCPYCGRHFMYVSVSRKLELYRRPKKGPAVCHESRTCKICHERVGIIYVAA